MKLPQRQLPGEVTAGTLRRAGAEAPHVPTMCCRNIKGDGFSRAHGGMLLRLVKTLPQTHSNPHTMAMIQNDT